MPLYAIASIRPLARQGCRALLADLDRPKPWAELPDWPISSCIWGRPESWRRRPPG